MAFAHVTSSVRLTVFVRLCGVTAGNIEHVTQMMRTTMMKDYQILLT